MKFHSLQAILAVILSAPPAVAQLIQNDIGTHSMVFKYNDAAKIGQTKELKDYSNVHGQYLWSNDWHRAAFIMRTGNIVKMKAVKLNFYTNEVHYPGKEGEMAASIDKVKRIMLYSNDPSDTTALVATFEVLPNNTTHQDFLYEVMNEGRVQLLKRVRISANKMRIDPIQSQETYYFYQSADYAIRSANAITEIKSLKKVHVFEAVPIASSGTEWFSANKWLSGNKNKLKNEKEVVDFINYLNSRNK